MVDVCSKADTGFSVVHTFVVLAADCFLADQCSTRSDLGAQTHAQTQTHPPMGWVWVGMAWPLLGWVWVGFQLKKVGLGLG